MTSNKDNEISTPDNSNEVSADLNLNCSRTPRPSCTDKQDSGTSPSILDHFRHSGSPQTNLIGSPRLSLSPIENPYNKQRQKVSFNPMQSTPVSERVTSINEQSRNIRNNFPFKDNSPTRSIGTSRTSLLKCRICLEFTKEEDKLVSPCRCKGSVGLMHSSCLEHWIQVCHQEFCEICKCRYEMNKRKPTCCSWLRELRSQRYFIGDVICFLFLVPCTSVAVYFCVQAAIFILTDENEDSLGESRWKGIGLIVLAMMLVFCLSVWITFTIKHYYRLFRDYQGERYRWSIHNRRKTITNLASTII